MNRLRPAVIIALALLISRCGSHVGASSACVEADRYAGLVAKLHALEWLSISPSEVRAIYGRELAADRAEIPPGSDWSEACTGSTYYHEKRDRKTCYVWIAFHDSSIGGGDCGQRLGSVAFRANMPHTESEAFRSRVVAEVSASGPFPDGGGLGYRWKSADGHTLYNLFTAVESSSPQEDVVFIKLVHTQQ